MRAAPSGSGPSDGASGSDFAGSASADSYGRTPTRLPCIELRHKVRRSGNLAATKFTAASTGFPKKSEMVGMGEAAHGVQNIEYDV